MMMEEDKNDNSISGIIQDAKDFVTERFKNPFLLSFTFFWLAFNWRIPFLVFFSDYPVLERYDIIERFYVWWEWILRGGVIPLVLALVYVFFKDYIFGKIEMKTKEPYIGRLNVRIDKQIEEIKATIRRIPHEQELADTKTKFVRYEEQKSKIEKLELDLETKKSELEKTKTELTSANKISNKLKELSDTLLESFAYVQNTLEQDKHLAIAIKDASSVYISKYGGYLDDFINHYNHISEKERKGDLEILINEGLLQFDEKSNDRSLSSYILTPFGLYILIANSLQRSTVIQSYLVDIGSFNEKRRRKLNEEKRRKENPNLNIDEETD